MRWRRKRERRFLLAPHYAVPDTPCDCECHRPPYPPCPRSGDDSCTYGDLLCEAFRNHDLYYRGDPSDDWT